MWEQWPGVVSWSRSWNGTLTAGQVMKELEDHSKVFRFWQLLEAFKQGMMSDLRLVMTTLTAA